MRTAIEITDTLQTLRGQLFALFRRHGQPLPDGSGWKLGEFEATKLESGSVYFWRDYGAIKPEVVAIALLADKLKEG